MKIVYKEQVYKPKTISSPYRELQEEKMIIKIELDSQDIIEAINKYALQAISKKLGRPMSDIAVNLDEMSAIYADESNVVLLNRNGNTKLKAKLTVTKI